MVVYAIFIWFGVMGTEEAELRRKTAILQSASDTIAQYTLLANIPHSILVQHTDIVNGGNNDIMKKNMNIMKIIAIVFQK